MAGWSGCWTICAAAYLGEPDRVVVNAAGRHRPRLQPVAEGLVDRTWYGGGSLRSAGWAGRAGLNLLIGNVTSGEGTDDFYTAQRRQLDAYRAAWHGARPARVALGRVIVPFDSADAWTRARYTEYAASRRERTLAPQGERRTLFAPDLVGTSEQILEALVRDPGAGGCLRTAAGAALRVPALRVRADPGRRGAPHPAAARLAGAGPRQPAACAQIRSAAEAWAPAGEASAAIRTTPA